MFDWISSQIRKLIHLGSLFICSTISLGVISLPPPYKTNCFDYKGSFKHGKDDCIHNCMVKKTVDFSRKWPFSIITTARANVSLITVDDMQNRTFSRIYNEINTLCAQQCSKEECISGSYLTNLLEVTVENDLGIRVLSSSEVSFNVILLPKLEIIEFIVYVFSCTGIWLGASVLKLQDVLIFMFRFKFKSSRRQTLSSRLRMRGIYNL